MVEQRIQQQFFESADLMAQSAEALSRPIHDAATAVLGALTSGGKVLAHGQGLSIFDAQRLVASLVGQFERDRPSLAALTLGGEGGLMHAVAAGDYAQVAAKQLMALGAPGDVLVLFAAEAPSPAWLALLGLAHDKDMSVVAITGRGSAAVASMMSETDVHIAVPSERLARIHEIQSLALHCLCDAVDLQLMGEQELA
jgi:D-sedoheptulose 7-phosphate isomerase